MEYPELIFIGSQKLDLERESNESENLYMIYVMRKLNRSFMWREREREREIVLLFKGKILHKSYILKII